MLIIQLILRFSSWYCLISTTICFVKSLAKGRMYACSNHHHSVKIHSDYIVIIIIILFSNVNYVSHAYLDIVITSHMFVMHVWLKKNV